VYGSPALSSSAQPRSSSSKDHVEQVFPREWLDELQEQQWQRIRQAKKSNPNHGALRILTRLHAVVENASDLRYYQAPSKINFDLIDKNLAAEAVDSTRRLLQGYDLVSIAPRNDAVFQSACQTATGADVITLDYTARPGGRGLPFALRSSWVRTAAQRGVVWEVPYSPAVLHSASSSMGHRRAFVQTIRELLTAGLGQKIRLLLSSGPRHYSPAGNEGEDAGSMALRMPADIVNVLETVLHMDRPAALATMTTNVELALETARRRRFGGLSTVVASVTASTTVGLQRKRKEYHDADAGHHRVNSLEATPRRKQKSKSQCKSDKESRGADTEEALERATHENEVCEDGFISLYHTNFS
jgi:RNase P/RNase MRP subunit p30